VKKFLIRILMPPFVNDGGCLSGMPSHNRMSATLYGRSPSNFSYRRCRSAIVSSISAISCSLS